MKFANYGVFIRLVTKYRPKEPEVHPWASQEPEEEHGAVGTSK